MFDIARRGPDRFPQQALKLRADSDKNEVVMIGPGLLHGERLVSPLLPFRFPRRDGPYEFHWVARAEGMPQECRGVVTIQVRGFTLPPLP
jgi:hypothetical protein